MKIYNFPQHTFDETESAQIATMVAQWADLNHETRTQFINSLNVNTNPEWLEVRCGKFTASNASVFLADSRTKGETIGDSCKTLCHKVMSERVGWREERNPYMEFASIRRGICLESTARKLASEKLGAEIKECGFVESDDGWFGCSPDGFVEKDGKIDALVEIKCPEPMNFYKQLMNAAKPEYQAQQQFAMNICDCPRSYFVLFCPEVSDQVYILKYTKGIAYQKKIEQRKKEVLEYIETVKKQVASGDINIETLE